MSVFDRYLTRELLLPFVVGLGLFFVIIVLAQTLQLADMNAGIGVSARVLLLGFAYSLPSLLGLLVPIAALFATLFAIGRLASEQELLGMAAAGRNPYRLLRVPALLGVLLSVVTLAALVWGEPWGVRGLRQLVIRGAQETLARGVRPGSFYEWVPGVAFLSHGGANGQLDHVFLADQRDPATPFVVTSKRGMLKPGARAEDVVLELHQGSVFSAQSDRDEHWMRFEQARYTLDVGQLVSRSAHTISRWQELDLAAMLHAIATLDDANRRAHLQVLLHRKFALPVAALLFVLLAVPLACRRRRGARAASVVLSTLIIASYYYVGRAAEMSARGGDMSPILAAWIPNILGLVALAVLLPRLNRGAA